jgi:UDP-N-acetylmuramoylalanine--D-glutamate ligase
VRTSARAEDFVPMAKALGASPVKGVYLIGTTAALLSEVFADLPGHPRVVQAGTLDAAMAQAWEAAAPGDAILLSPGCESFDQFADYRARGDRFCALAEQLPARAGKRTPV